jgi:hypothetical protein
MIGLINAYASQYIIQHFLYPYANDWILPTPVSVSTDDASSTITVSATGSSSLYTILFLSIVWSLISCFMVFVGMIMATHVVEKFVFAVNPIKTTGTSSTDEVKDDIDDAPTKHSSNDENENDTLLFHMETSYVSGAIVSILLLWMKYDFGIQMIHSISTFDIYKNHGYQSSVVPPLTMMMVFLMMILIGVTILIRYINTMLRQQNKDDAESQALLLDSSTSVVGTTTPKEWLIYGIASTLGLFIGMGTQLVLSLLLWNNLSRVPFILRSNLHIALFSFGWSTITVLITALACYLLRTCIFHSMVQYMTSVSYHDKNVLILRMEAMYIGWTLTGICIGWIILDVLHDMTSQIYISLVLFMMSLSSFVCILYYFPESDVGIDDDDYDENFDVEDAMKNSLTEPLLVLSTHTNDNDDEKQTIIIACI